MINEISIFPIYLFYGMAFFAIGVAITSRDTSASNLKISRSLWLFALFAYSHAFLEWFTLYLILLPSKFSEGAFLYLNEIKLGLVTISFTFLLLFGLSLLRIVYSPKKGLVYLIPLLLAVAIILSVPLAKESVSIFPLSAADIKVRNFIGFPGAIISCLGLILYSRTVHHISNKGALNFIGAGISLAFYGVFAGLVPSGTSLPLVDTPVELFRGILAFVILHFVMHALYIFDVERKHQVEESLNRFAQSEKLHSLGKLAFGVAHEINNPLGNISLNIELLKNDLDSNNIPFSYDKRFSSIERNLDRASNIARELLYFSTNKEADYQSTNLNDVLESTIGLLGARQKKYLITKHLGSIPAISAIPWKLEEVFLNILVNAMDAIPEGGSIQISTSQKSDKVVVIIKDNGAGISSDHMPYVMDPFYTTKDVDKGTGLGLSICYGIMELHRGKIELESQPGEGTTVSLFFPVGEEDNV